MRFMLITASRRLALNLTLGRWSTILKILEKLAELASWIVSNFLLDHFHLFRRQLQIKALCDYFGLFTRLLSTRVLFISLFVR